jgi:hypothetical protein
LVYKQGCDAGTLSLLLLSLRLRAAAGLVIFSLFFSEGKNFPAEINLDCRPCFFESGTRWEKGGFVTRKAKEKEPSEATTT